MRIIKPHKFRLIVAVGLLILSCGGHSQPDEFGLTQDHYEILDESIAHAIAGHARDRDLIVVRKIPDFARTALSNLPRPYDLALRELGELGGVELYVQALNQAGMEAVSLDSLIAEDIRKRERGERDYRDGIRVSPVGFNPDRSTGVVWCSWSCGNQCGYGKLLFFSRRNGKWVLEKQVVLQII